MALNLSTVPSFADWQQFWSEMERDVTREDLKDPAMDQLLKALRGVHDNGGAEFVSFKLPAHQLLEWARTRNRFNEIIEKFVSLPQVQASGPPFQPMGKPETKLELEISHALTLDGEIARALVFGGAYTRFSGGGKTAKQLTSKFCYALFQDRFDDIVVYKAHSAWSNWFKDVAWDKTWFCFDSREMRLSVLSMTDTD
jgi:hypothetical protein